MSVGILGSYSSRCGKLENSTIYDLIVEAGRGAIADAGIAPRDIDGIWMGNFSAGAFNNQEHIAAWGVEIDPALLYKPCTRAEVACASGSAAVRGARLAIGAGEARFVLVIGVEKMTTLDREGVTHALAMASYWPEEGSKGMTFPGLFGMWSKAYREHYGYSDEQMDLWQAMVHAKNRDNATHNELAHMYTKPSSLEFAMRVSEKNPLVADPLKLTDCSLVSDGAAALVLGPLDDVRALRQNVVEITSQVLVTDHIQSGKRELWHNVAGKMAVDSAYRKAGITAADVDVAEVHDCFTINEMLSYEAMGLCPEGEGGRLIEHGGVVQPDGTCPINLSGGLIGKGHPVGATGVSMHVYVSRQLEGRPLGLAAKNPEVGVVMNVGGSNVSNFASVLKRVK
ncbi:MAG: thiolase domain-containing protein [Caldiserica bacterium]|nr:thiolase domain-containing protein [Caldisericota bacterium]